ncbi:hypothetical protein BDZ91DRAFT_725930 [Kalaharituber pfeilii]|nr:hypothetical protein BDZ91DRAFT_725930 [Kalaharituber pfeilii]
MSVIIQSASRHPVLIALGVCGVVQAVYPGAISQFVPDRIREVMSDIFPFNRFDRIPSVSLPYIHLPGIGVGMPKFGGMSSPGVGLGLRLGNSTSSASPQPADGSLDANTTKATSDDGGVPIADTNDYGQSENKNPDA